ncbi:hypothetical protein PENTCL1PPCAC_4913, partial [Pristionchus entomophagus]
QANPEIVSACIDKLSTAAQVAAIKQRDLVSSDEQDVMKLITELRAIQSSASEDVQKELEVHNREVAIAVGL